MAAHALNLDHGTRNKRGEAPGFNGTHFDARQGETIFFSDPQHPNWDADEGRIFLVELADGFWLADQAADATRYDSRAEALTAAASSVIWRVTKRAGEIGYAQSEAIVNWAADLGNVEAPQVKRPAVKVAALVEVAKVEVTPPATKKAEETQMGLFG